MVKSGVLLISSASQKEGAEAQRLASDQHEISQLSSGKEDQKQKQLLARAVCFGFGIKITWGLLNAFLAVPVVHIHSAQVPSLLALMQRIWARSLSVIITFLTYLKVSGCEIPKILI